MDIDSTIGTSLVNLASTLSTLALKGTATAIHGKIESIKNEKDCAVIRRTYDEIVNELLQEREDAIRIAQTYKQELERVVISDEDIEHLQQTIQYVLEVFNIFQPVNTLGDDLEKQSKFKINEDTIKCFKGLVSKDVLKTMQLLGFNYKAAIGEPLTKICANAILSLTGKEDTLKENQVKKTS